jgi:hypothetical protein
LPASRQLPNRAGTRFALVAGKSIGDLPLAGALAVRFSWK